MPTPAPDTPDTSPQGAFAGLGAGMDFFKDWMKAAAGAMPHLGGTQAAGTVASGWAVPTLDPQELDKRIQELKTVQFWLEQNARMLSMTIQTMEVQRMTLQTLHEMQVPLETLKEGLKARPTAAPEAPAANATTSDAPETGAGAAANPLHWWNTLTEQFGHLATQAVQAGQQAMQDAQQTIVPDADSDADPAGQPTRQAAARKSAPRKTAPRKKAP